MHIITNEMKTNPPIMATANRNARAKIFHTSTASIAPANAAAQYLIWRTDFNINGFPG